MPDQDPLQSIDLSDALDTPEGAVEAHETLAQDHADVAVIPEIAESARFTSALGNGLHFMGTALSEQASQAVRAMFQVSDQMGRQAQTVVAKMAEVGEQVTRREVTPESGEIAIQAYLHALQLYGHAVENRAKVEAYVRGMRLLETGKKVLFSLLRMGLQAALPTTGNAIAGLASLAAASLPE
jgi:hypothetical protein